MTNITLGRFAAAIICAASVCTACASDSEDSPVNQQERVIKFEGIENGRDMGGLVMQDGRSVSFGKLVRSANLSEATDADVAILKNRYQLTDVFDFRFEAEEAAAPDRIIEGVTYTQLSTLPASFLAAAGTGIASSGIIDTRDLGALLMQFAFNPQMQAMAKQLYPAIVTEPQSQSYYGEFLRGVLKAKGGVLWHCSQGKDRAGWAAAFVLAALGASREVIVQDFDLSNESYAAKVEALSSQLRDKAKQQSADGTTTADTNAAIAFIKAMIGVSRENFEATLDLIDQKYGSMEQYIENQLAFSKEEQQQLRNKYLTNTK